MRLVVIALVLCLAGCETRQTVSEQAAIDRQGTIMLTGVYAGQPFELQMQFQGQEQVKREAQILTKTTSPFGNLFSSWAPMAKLIANATGFGWIATLASGVGTAAAIGGGLWMQHRKRKTQQRMQELAELEPEKATERLKGMS